MSADTRHAQGMDGWPKKLSVVQFNARSPLPKKSEFAHVASTLQPHLIARCETWLNDSFPDAAFFPDGYSVASRVDRANGNGGGVIGRSDVQGAPRKVLCCWTENAWIEVSLRSSCRRKLLFGCF